MCIVALSIFNLDQFPCPLWSKGSPNQDAATVTSHPVWNVDCPSHTEFGMWDKIINFGLMRREHITFFHVFCVPYTAYTTKKTTFTFVSTMPFFGHNWEGHMADCMLNRDPTYRFLSDYRLLGTVSEYCCPCTVGLFRWNIFPHTVSTGLKLCQTHSRLTPETEHCSRSFTILVWILFYNLTAPQLYAWCVCCGCVPWGS